MNNWIYALAIVGAGLIVYGAIRYFIGRKILKKDTEEINQEQEPQLESPPKQEEITEPQLPKEEPSNPEPVEETVATVEDNLNKNDA